MGRGPQALCSVRLALTIEPCPVFWIRRPFCGPDIVAPDVTPALIFLFSYMQKEDVADMYISKAEHLETLHKYKEAEQLYITVDEP